MSVTYLRGAGVVNPEGTRVLVTGAQGAVSVDEPVLRLWNAAAGLTLDEILPRPDLADLRDVLPEAVACLAEAALLQRDPTVQCEPDTTGSHVETGVSAIVVVSSAAELVWLADCLESLHMQSSPPAEIILVDNGGVTTAPLPNGVVPVRLCRRSRRGTYAAALNDGAAEAGGSHLLLLNADVRLMPRALERMLARARQDARIAAVAPKLRFWRTPAFLNGIGNRVQGLDWGTDNAIGHLDLGQFDHWTDVPSGCFAALLISAAALRDVGPFDAAYPAYFEDADWAYRARMRGYRIAAAPDADVLHVFGATWNEPGADRLSNGKYARAAAGRLRFLWKLPGGAAQRKLVPACMWLDCHVAFDAIGKRDAGAALACARGLMLFAAGLPSATMLRRRIQRRRRIGDDELFGSGASMPRSALDGAKPLLTSTLIRDYYAPLIRAGRTRPLPEMMK